ncbi:hypothetical protein ACIQCD_21580 [Streptomyces sp. NPDC093250]|uniref:hypothetical protein n=1 Tax=unclassified Streptomyces TaxID=2593676 RepID=UPI00340A046D
MTSSPSAGDHLPVYDGLVRERGDIVAEAREVAEHAQYQARQALAGHSGVRREPPARPRTH